jgi:hypothetical protein
MRPRHFPESNRISVVLIIVSRKLSRREFLDLQSNTASLTQLSSTLHGTDILHIQCAIAYYFCSTNKFKWREMLNYGLARVKKNTRYRYGKQLKHSHTASERYRYTGIEKDINHNATIILHLH